MAVSTRRRQSTRTEDKEGASEGKGSKGLTGRHHNPKRPGRRQRGYVAQTQSSKAHNSLTEQEESEVDAMATLHVDPPLSSSPSQAPSSVFDGQDTLLGWTSSSSCTTQCPLSTAGTGKRMRVGWKIGEREASFEGEESPTLQVKRKRRLEGARDSAEAVVTTTRSGRVVRKTERGLVMPTRRTRSDPLPPRHRARTPPSTSRSVLGEPSRPQSSMKHKSANKYSLGGDDDVMVITSLCQMPEREESPASSQFYAPALPASAPHPIDRDPDAFSPDHQQGRKEKAGMERYVLHARDSLPKSSFYARNKEEEGSPTPESRQRDSLRHRS